MTPLTFEEIQAVAGGVTAGPGGAGCTGPNFPIMLPEVNQSSTAVEK
ncbi:MAG: hypothetical protein AB7E55_13805 [Pigmentiphaga sp.]